MKPRIDELRRFLTEARGSVSPEQAGLPRDSRRRVRGLRREEVAELAGISEIWYARFESGRAVLSLSALDRVADALRLSTEGRRRLIVLARPDVRDSTFEGLSSSLSGVGFAVKGLHDFARSCCATSSVADLARLATNTLHRTCGSRSMGFFQAYNATASSLVFVALSGNEGEILEGYRQPLDTIPHVGPQLFDGHAVGESDLRESPSEELRARVDMGYFSYATQPILGRVGLHSVVGVAFTEPHMPDPLQARVLEATAAISELALKTIQ